MQEKVAELCEDLSFDSKIVSFSTDDMIPEVHKYPEVWYYMDVTVQSNRQKRVCSSWLYTNIVENAQ